MLQRSALLIVDVQIDFFHDGALPVPMAHRVLDPINALAASEEWDVVVASQDWHPPGHCSFAHTHGLQPFSVGPDGTTVWPEHCVAGSWGAAFHPSLNQAPIDAIFRKGTRQDLDSLSAFGHPGDRTGLSAYLLSKDVTSVTVVGLALDHCVSATAIDARLLGFRSSVRMMATMPVDQTLGGMRNIIRRLTEAGVEV